MIKWIVAIIIAIGGSFITAYMGYIERMNIMNKHINKKDFKTTEMKGTIKLEPEDVKLDEDDSCPGCKYAIDLTERLIDELGPNWAEQWKVAETNLTPEGDFYKIDVTVERREI